MEIALGAESKIKKKTDRIVHRRSYLYSLSVNGATLGYDMTMEDRMKQISLENIGVAALFIVGFFAMASLWAHWASECDDGKLSSCAFLVGSL